MGKCPRRGERTAEIIAYDHDRTGEALARDFLSEYGEGEEFVDSVSALVRWHMQPFFVVRGLPFSDVDSMMRQTNADEIALLSYCDRLGRGDLSEETVAVEKKNAIIFLEKCQKYGLKK